MKRFTPFSGYSPTLEDFEYQNDAVENAILDRQKEMFSNGVVKGLTITGTDPYNLEPGIAYINGERIEITEAIEISGLTTPASGSINYVFLKYATELVGDEKAHAVTGNKKQVRIDDSFIFRVAENSNEVAQDSEGNDIELLLGSINAAGTITDLRTAVYFEHKLRQIDSDDPDTMLEFGAKGTSAANFYVGMGTSRERKVLTSEVTPVTPMNFRVAEIRSLGLKNSSEYDEEIISDVVRQGVVSSNALVVFKWGWNDIQGTGNGSIFECSNLPGVGANDLIGQMFYIPSENTDYVIVSNTDSSESPQCTLTLENIDLTPANFSDLTISSNDAKGIIHSNATEYIIQLQQNKLIEEDEKKTYVKLKDRFKVGSSLIKMRVEDSDDNSPVSQTYEVELPIGSYWDADIKAKNGNTNSDYSKHLDAFKVAIDFIDGWNTLEISAKATEYGFNVTLPNSEILKNLSGIVYGYAPLKVFATGGYDILKYNTTICNAVPQVVDVMTNSKEAYHFGVRPLISGQYVGNLLTSGVVSGGSGYLPVDKTFAPIDVEFNYTNFKLKTFEGKICIYENETGQIAKSDISTNLKGQRFVTTYDGKDLVFLIKDTQIVIAKDDAQVEFETYALVLEELSNTNANAEAVFEDLRDVYIGGVGSAIAEQSLEVLRRIYAFRAPSEITITGLSFDVTSTDGNDEGLAGVIRVYQEGHSGLATSIEICGSAGEVLHAESSLQIVKYKDENMNVIIDAVSKDIPEKNKAKMTGKLTVHYVESLI